MPRERIALQFRNAAASPLGSITAAGFGVLQKRALGEPRVLGQFALVYLLAGEGSYEDANGWQRKLVPGDFVLVFPEVRHLYNPDAGTKWVVSFLCFSGPIFDLWKQQRVLDARIPIFHREPVDEWNRRLENVLGAKHQIGSDPGLMEICRLMSLLAEILTGKSGVAAREEDRRWVQRACGVIEASLGESADWEHIARQFGLSSEGFRKRFTRLSGHTPARYRTGRLIDRACEMMCETPDTDREIANRLGFCDEFYFSRRFKETTGRSPRAFRRGLALEKYSVKGVNSEWH